MTHDERKVIIFVAIVPVWSVEHDDGEVYRSPVRVYWSNRNICEGNSRCFPVAKEGAPFYTTEPNFPSVGAAFCWWHWHEMYRDPNFQSRLEAMTADEYEAERQAEQG